ncbi:MAG: MotA/TolQ/ExbB proton channel family protein [Limnochordaceae bacterium]|nr:MotA/TolQ/ExbB proton channel family protein [Limnochordaceae bacterium]
MLDVFAKGGPTMYALLLCSVVALAITIERLWFFWKVHQPADELMDDVRQTLAEGKMVEAMQLARDSDSPTGALLAAAIERCDEGRQAMEDSLEREAGEQLARLERGLPILDVIVTIAPFLGLLGTVLGIIRAFNVMGSLQGVDSPTRLSVGIAEALITTAAGLIVAIPTLVAHRYLSSRVDEFVAEMNVQAYEILDMLQQSLPAQAPAKPLAAAAREVE